jgi:outer membrane biosynthesis protein TonB
MRGLPHAIRSDRVKVGAGAVVAAAAIAFAISGRDPSEGRQLFGSAPTQETADAPRTERDAEPRTSAVGQAEQTRKRSRSKPAAPKQEATTTATPAPAPSEDSTDESPPAAPAPSPDPAPTSRKSPSSPSAPAPRPSSQTVTSERVRALGGADLDGVQAALGPSLTTAALRQTFGAGPVASLRRHEPAGRICRYWALAPSEPAPLVRICFDANGHQLAAEYVTPPSR